MAVAAAVSAEAGAHATQLAVEEHRLAGMTLNSLSSSAKSGGLNVGVSGLGPGQGPPGVTVGGTVAESESEQFSLGIQFREP